MPGAHVTSRVLSLSSLTDTQFHIYTPRSTIPNAPQKKHEAAEKEARRQQKAKKAAEEKYLTSKMDPLEEAKNRTKAELEVRTHARRQYSPAGVGWTEGGWGLVVRVMPSGAPN